MKKSILFVCLGNICRSPTAEGVFKYLLKTESPQLRVDVDSAGTADYHRGRAPDERSRRAALRRGINLSGHRARRVTPEDFSRFDLILAMDRQNLLDLQSMAPPAARAQLGLFLEYAEGLEELDVPDPYYGDGSAFERVLDLTTQAARGLIAALSEPEAPR